MVSTETRYTVLFVGLALVLWYATTLYTDNVVVQGAVLLGVGVVAPTLLTEWLRSRAE